MKITENKKATTADKLINLSTTNEKVKIRNAIYNNISLIDDFCKDNPGNFSRNELLIVDSWKKFLKGRFYVVRLLKDCAIFLDDKTPAHVYGVKALNNDFDEIFGFRPFPVLIETVLLPFKNQVIYDGFFNLIPIVFGAGIRADINDSYLEVKAKFGIVTNLNETNEVINDNNRDEKTLKYYLQNVHNRDFYSQEIHRLAHKSRNLEVIYYLEMAKWNSRRIAKDLKKVGIERAFFAVLENTVVSSGQTLKEAKTNAEKIVPKEKLPFIYIFQVK